MSAVPELPPTRSFAEQLYRETMEDVAEGDKALSATSSSGEKYTRASLAYQRATVLALLSVGERLEELGETLHTALENVANPD